MPLNLSHPDFQIGVVWDLHLQEHPLMNAPGVQTEPSDNAQNQLNVSTTGETRQERIEVSNSEGVTISPQTDQLRENQDIPARPALSPRTQRNDLESNEENVNTYTTYANEKCKIISSC